MSDAGSGGGDDQDAPSTDDEQPQQQPDTHNTEETKSHFLEALEADFMQHTPASAPPRAAPPTPMQEIQAAFAKLTTDLDRSIRDATRAQDALDARERSVRSVHRDSLAPTMKVLVGGQPFEFKRDTVREVASDGALLKDLVDGNFGAPQDTTPFLDRDPTMFQHVLQWHRNGGQLPSMVCMNRCTLEDLRFESGFYSEPKLGEQVTAEMARREQRAAGRWVDDPVIRRRME